MRQLFLMIAAVAAFITIVGFLTKKSEMGELNLNLPTSKPPPKNLIVIKDKEIKVDLANTPALRKRGLSGKENLSDDEGMLFVFETKDVNPTFWMKGMLIPIDIIWINDGKITQIDSEVAPPKSPDVDESTLPLYQPKDPIDYALEVKSGFAKDNKIKVGDSVDLSGIL